MSKQNMIDLKKKSLKIFGFDKDMATEVKVKLSNNTISGVEHTPEFIVMLDQMIEAGDKLTVGVDIVPLLSVDGTASIDVVEELSIKLKGVNYNMYLHLIDLYTQVDKIDKRLSDVHYQEALDNIQWAFDISQLFNYELQY